MRTTLGDRNKVVTEEQDVVKKFKDHFEKMVETLKIEDLNGYFVLNAIELFLKMKQTRNSSDCFFSPLN